MCHCRRKSNVDLSIAWSDHLVLTLCCLFASRYCHLTSTRSITKSTLQRQSEVELLIPQIVTQQDECDILTITQQHRGFTITMTPQLHGHTYSSTIDRPDTLSSNHQIGTSPSLSPV
ncbi:unnamed protein product [Protopolystoma xenopodis]|uniref:Uncharacterized protein n=1 Tax=Protopolystoma xenopodis TaxID=117903 RepID=A0A448XEV8_9PLAT|nr:unnamed protein product [Protopolystoma xenopodis]